MANEGLLLQMDGSNHNWFASSKATLIGAIDDASSEIPYAEFFDGETTFGCMQVLRRIIEKKGVPEALYVDQAHCFAGPRAAEYTQFARALRAKHVSFSKKGITCSMRRACLKKRLLRSISFRLSS